MKQPTREERIQAILKEEAAEAFGNGISLGLEAANRIMVWFTVNHQLVKPHSAETLKQWAENELNQLREKLKKGPS